MLLGHCCSRASSVNWTPTDEVTYVMDSSDQADRETNSGYEWPVEGSAWQRPLPVPIGLKIACPKSVNQYVRSFRRLDVLFDSSAS